MIRNFGTDARGYSDLSATVADWYAVLPALPQSVQRTVKGKLGMVARGLRDSADTILCLSASDTNEVRAAFGRVFA